MTEQEFIAAVAQLEEADTELAGLDRKIAEAIANARAHNLARKQIEVERDALRASVLPVRQAVERHMQEMKRLHSLKAQADAAAAEKAAQEQRAAALAEQASQPTNADLLKKIEALEAQIKG